MPKSVGMVHLSKKSYKNIRTKNGLSHPGWPVFDILGRKDSNHKMQMSSGHLPGGG